jgi:hypothetical protein
MGNRPTKKRWLAKWNLRGSKPERAVQKQYLQDTAPQKRETLDAIAVLVAIAGKNGKTLK